jgi:putative membrane protein
MALFIRIGAGMRDLVRKDPFPCVLYSFFAFGIFGHALPQTAAVVTRLTPLVLLGFSLCVLFLSARSNKILLLWCLGTYIFTFAIEAVGVWTGLIFGRYFYGNTLGLKLLNVPLVIGLNWVVVVLGAVGIARLVFKNAILTAAAAGVLTVIFDIPLEVVAVNLDYWHWPGGSVPLQNYAAWFVISFIAGIVAEGIKLDFEKKHAVHYLIAQLVFFIALNVIIGLNGLHVK